MHSLLQDLRYGTRMLAKSPGFSADKIETLEDEANFAVPYARPLADIQVGHGMTFQHIVALSRRIQQPD